MLIKIKVKTDSRKEMITQKNDDSFIVSVREPAERGEANGRVLELLKSMFPGKSVKLISGHHKPGKIVEVG
jgi:uncharacterized protein (TIGR00251 family)